MSREARDNKLPEAYCDFCSARTPHLYERLAINRRLTSRAVCLACNNERPKEAAE
jgi:hypothetical protein